MSDPILTLYAVRNSEGEWLRSKGYGGGGKTWVEEIEGARIYSRIGPARARVTYFARNFPDWPAPELVALQVTACETLDEAGRVAAATSKLDARKSRSEAMTRAWRLANAKQDLAAARQLVRKLETLP